MTTTISRTPLRRPQLSLLRPSLRRVSPLGRPRSIEARAALFIRCIPQMFDVCLSER
jgi:hypothetical protein